MGKVHVIISAFIKAEYTDATNSTLTFTHETWEDVHAKRDKFHSDKKIIGWQHTHPGYGIFLSNYDVFIQQNFFNLPYQIAYVIDPIANIEGFFYNGQSKPDLLAGYNIYDDIGKKIIVKNEIEKPKAEGQSKGKERVLGGLLILSLLIVGTLGYVAFDKNNDLADIKSQNVLLAETLEKSKADFGELKTYVDDQASNGFSAAEIADIISQINGKAPLSQTEENLIKELEAIVSALGTEDNGSTFSLKLYEVKSGDTLHSICTALGLEYTKFQSIIVDMNGLTNPNNIDMGQLLIMPSINK
jgi:proteasome lid subunit RPN8/RPN11